ncbi:unnamed protein product [Kluyveromyces dobzhanskii CBS 2104]|uniref:WGS project CCBQ000000000 data, contig 00009 n=1 Tax=Kluyveromyces dobzhanskii CBS 2104 TaxID=1427455 RepID=A0A0A8L546_9SACH|nr:unnamed protein product [Kluyveromyces dobzhanskii CBS 2104]
MNESRIPSINARKRPRPFSSGFISASDVKELTDVAGNKKHHPVLANITNMAMSTTGTAVSSNCDSKRESFGPTYQSKSQTTNMRLLNKYFYGDPSVIEEVKKRERKALKDIHLFTKQIDETDAEQESLSSKIIPQLKYDLNKRSIVFKHLKQETIAMQQELYQLNNDCELKKKSHELIINNMSLKHSVNMQEAINRWQQIISEKRHALELELQKLKQTEPDPAVVKEIQNLKSEKLEREKSLKRLQQENESLIQSHDEALKLQLEKFKDEKKEPLIESIAENKSLKNKVTYLKASLETLKGKIQDSHDTELSLKDTINQKKEELRELEESLEPGEQALSELQLKFKSEKDITDKVKAQAKLAEVEYNKNYDRMEQEQLQRRVLENTIDELDGHIRCFAYVNQNEIVNDYEVDYMNKCIIGDTGAFYFNRILPRDLMSPSNLFNNECFTFIDSCLKDKKSCNIISINDDLRKDFLETIHEQFCESKVLVQMVVLNDDDLSKDMLNSQDSDLSAVIDEKCIDFHSKRLPIEEVGSFIQPNFKGIHVMKFEVFSSDEKFESIFFIQAPMSEMQKLNTIRLTEPAATPVATFLQSLLLRLQSLIIFNFDTPDASLLQLSQTLHKLPNPK